MNTIKEKIKKTLPKEMAFLGSAFIFTAIFTLNQNLEILWFSFVSYYAGGFVENYLQIKNN